MRNQKLINLVAYLMLLIICSCNSENKVTSKENFPSSSSPLVFQNQQLKEGEQIIKIHWGMDNVVKYERDYDGVRYTTNNIKVPNGKKWVLLYMVESYWYDSGLQLQLMPDIFIDGKDMGSFDKGFADSTTINLSRAKDKWFKVYSNSTILCVSSRRTGVANGGNFTRYVGDIWFLEMNE
jgi:hypothetical protein